MIRKRLLSAGTTLLLLIALAGCGGSGGTTAGLDPAGTRSAPDADAVSEARAQTAADPTEPYWPYRLGLAAADKDPAAAEARFEESLARDPIYAPALAALSDLWFAQARHAEAVGRLEGALAAGASPDALRAALALHWAALGDGARAEESLGGERGAHTASVEPFVLLTGDDFLEAGEPAAREHRAHPKSAVHRNNFGITLLHRGDPVAAQAEFLAAHEADPNLPGPLYNLAIVETFYFMNHDAGRRWLDRYFRLAVDDPDGVAAALGTAEPADDGADAEPARGEAP